ncbi:MAG: alanine racemase [Bacteroidetes bacterium]|nr:alanine racemase [Bacteroidota bacterium]
MKNKYASHIVLSRSAYWHNIQFIRKLIGKDVELSLVVKGNAYGHGIRYLVPLAEEAGIRHFCVFSADEALMVKAEIRFNSEILIMGMLTDDQLVWAIQEEIQFYVFNKERLHKCIELAKKINKPAHVHIEIETGMNRTGFSMEALPDVMELMKSHPNELRWEGVCTHFAGAESIANYYRIQQQKKIFKKAIQFLKNNGVNPGRIHAACSAAAIRYPESIADMARIGILQYGFFPSREVLIDYLTRKKIQESPLKRIISWRSQVMTTKYVKRGEFIGYGNAYFTDSETRIAVVPVGYSLGYSRSLSNHGRVLIKGRFAPVIGLVNMNMMSVDVTHIDGVENGDEVVLIGRQGEQEISVSSFSDFSDQVNYELLTRLPSKIPRIVVD